MYIPSDIEILLVGIYPVEIYQRWTRNVQGSFVCNNEREREKRGGAGRKGGEEEKQTAGQENAWQQQETSI